MRHISQFVIFIVAIILFVFGISLGNDVMTSTGFIILVISLSTEIIVESIKNNGDDK